MASINAVAERIAIAVGKQEDIAYMETIKFSLLHHRAEAIRRDIDRNNVSDGYLQRVTLPIESYNPLEAMGSTKIKCMQRTVHKIPAPVRLKANEDFRFVGSLITGEPFEKHHISELSRLKYSRTTTDTIAYDYVNGYLEIYNGCGLKYVSIQAAFENPYEIKDDNGESCITGDAEFACPADILRFIVDGLINNELRLIPNNQTINVNE